MAFQLLAMAFAALMLVRHGPAAMSFLARGAAPGTRWRALPAFLTAVVAVLLLFGSLAQLVRRRA